MKLSEKQMKFSRMLAELILWVNQQPGYGVVIGEVFRSTEQAALNAKSGSGISNSLHTKCLAADLNLFKDGVYLKKTEDHLFIGEHWEKMGGTWGGRFGDGNHYSLEHEGVK